MSAPEAFQSIDPSNGQLVKTFAAATDAEVSAALDKAHNAYNKVWRATPVEERAKILARLAALIRQNKPEMVELGVTEMGKLIAQMEGEIDFIVSIIEYYAEHAVEFSQPVVNKLVPGTKVVTESLGVILAIEPWNFPFYQVIRVAACQLAAGNAVMVKPANSVAGSALFLEKLILQAGAPEGVFQVILATIPQIGTLIDDFRIRGVAMTGSERAGRAVAERAGKNLKKAVLELGGSDPFIVLEDADLEEAIQVGFESRMAGMGQVCVALKRHIVIGRERGEKYKEGFAKLIKGMKVGDPRDRDSTVGPLFADIGVTRLQKQVEDAKAAGATVVVGGSKINRPGAYFEPTLITGITKENPLFLEETFGPVASLYVVDTEEEAIELANATTFGLGGAIASTNIEHAQRVAAQIDSGMIFINSGLNDHPSLSFGGVKNSGIGRELGELGFHEFVNKKMIRVHEKYV
ncbi:aldehyde dehydrogenase [Trichoderma austrokoningii]